MRQVETFGVNAYALNIACVNYVMPRLFAVASHIAGLHIQSRRIKLF